MAALGTVGALQLVLKRLPTVEAQRSKEFDHILSGDYYMPGHKDDV